MNVSDLARYVSRTAWCKMLIDTADPALADPRLPGLPPEDVQKITNNVAGAATLRAAAVVYENTASLIAKHNPQLRDPNILDFGCGWGRIARFLPQLTTVENIYGTDVDAGLIKACHDHLHAPNYAVMTSGAALPYPDAMFDVVLSNSVFSHLSEASHRFHVGEIARVLKPGGLFLGSVLSARVMAQMYEVNTAWIAGVTGPRAEAEAALARGEFVYGSTGRWTDYGIAFVPDGWTRTNWAPALEVIDQFDGAQQINVARRLK
jgi:ubiquinone/menaquinone biosynthesis C-methylase UbiE